MIDKVKYCQDCPFMSYNDFGYLCNHPKQESDGWKLETLFETCPLKKEPITIELETDDKTTQ